MAEAISNTSPLYYLHQLQILDWIPQIFPAVWIPKAVTEELAAGQRLGLSVPNAEAYTWIRTAEPQRLPSEWLALDLGPGELAVLALGLEQPSCVLLLDDALARRIAQSAGLKVWGTLRVLLETKKLGLVPHVEPLINKLQSSGMWISHEVRQRILVLAGEV